MNRFIRSIAALTAAVVATAVLWPDWGSAAGVVSAPRESLRALGTDAAVGLAAQSLAFVAVCWLTLGLAAATCATLPGLPERTRRRGDAVAERMLPGWLYRFATCAVLVGLLGSGMRGVGPAGADTPAPSGPAGSVAVRIEAANPAHAERVAPVRRAALPVPSTPSRSETLPAPGVPTVRTAPAPSVPTASPSALPSTTPPRTAPTTSPATPAPSSPTTSPTPAVPTVPGTGRTTSAPKSPTAPPVPSAPSVPPAPTTGSPVPPTSQAHLPAPTPPRNAPAGRASASVTVAAGDCLWLIATRRLGADATDAQIAAATAALYAANRSVVGDDPDLIHPGQVLTVPDDLTT